MLFPYTDYDLVGRILEKIDARKRELDTVLTHLDPQNQSTFRKSVEKTQKTLDTSYFLCYT